LTLCKSLQHSQIPLRRGIFSKIFILALSTHCTTMSYRRPARRLRISAKSHAEQDKRRHSTPKQDKRPFAKLSRSRHLSNVPRATRFARERNLVHEDDDGQQILRVRRPRRIGTAQAIQNALFGIDKEASPLAVRQEGILESMPHEFEDIPGAESLRTSGLIRAARRYSSVRLVREMPGLSVLTVTQSPCWRYSSSG